MQEDIDILAIIILAIAAIGIFGGSSFIGGWAGFSIFILESPSSVLQSTSFLIIKAMENIMALEQFTGLNISSPCKETCVISPKERTLLD